MINATDLPSAIELLQSKFDVTWPHIQAAREAAGRKREEITGVLLASKQKFCN
jgi:outer membrane murein-binding lipoprotein Lpp